jgi:hypothetical protein
MFVIFNKLPYLYFMRRVPLVSPAFQRDKIKANLIGALTNPKGSRRLRLPDF